MGDRLLTDRITQLQQLPLNAFVAPAILKRQTHHQSLDFPIEAWPSATVPLPVRPFPAHQFSMPAENGLGFHNPNHIPQLFDGATGCGFQVDRQHHQRQFFSTGQSHGLALFALIDRQLPA